MTGSTSKATPRSRSSVSAGRVTMPARLCFRRVLSREEATARVPQSCACEFSPPSPSCCSSSISSRPDPRRPMSRPRCLCAVCERYPKPHDQLWARASLPHATSTPSLVVSLSLSLGAFFSPRPHLCLCVQFLLVVVPSHPLQPPRDDVSHLLCSSCEAWNRCSATTRSRKGAHAPWADIWRWLAFRA